MKSPVPSVIAALLLLLSSCSTPATEGDSREECGQRDSLSYAKYFTIDNYDGYTAVEILDPWHEGAAVALYYFVENDSVSTPKDGAKIKVPLERVALNSCSHIAFTELLNSIDKVIGMSSPEYVYNPALSARIASGECQGIGDAFALNFEKTASLPLDAIVVTKYDNPDQNIARLENAGLPVIYNVEWMEPDILGRAEWIKLFGILYGKRQAADSIFNQVTANFNKLVNIAADVETRPSLMAGLPFKGTWYMPAGQSYMARLFAAAGASYKHSDNDGKGSLPLSLESVLMDFEDADIWVGTDAVSLAEIEKSDERLTHFKAYKEGRVYNQKKRRTPSGGNDFWELAVARPDLLLQDLLVIIHPELLPDGTETVFMEKLK